MHGSWQSIAGAEADHDLEDLCEQLAIVKERYAT